MFSVDVQRFVAAQLQAQLHNCVCALQLDQEMATQAPSPLQSTQLGFRWCFTTEQSNRLVKVHARNKQQTACSPSARVGC